jgi:hypothetical protein
MPTFPSAPSLAMSRPWASNPRPLDWMLSRKVDSFPSLSMRVSRRAPPSVKMTVPSGNAIGPSVPFSVSVMSWTRVPPATTPGMWGV